MSLSAVHHYTFNTTSTNFKSITTPSPEQRTIFGGILNDVTSNVIRRRSYAIVTFLLIIWIIAIILSLTQTLPLIASIGIVILSIILALLLFKMRRRTGPKLVDDVMDHLRKRKFHYDNLLREIAYTVNYSFHFNGKSMVGYIEFIPIEDMIHMNQMTDRSRLDTFENNNHTFEMDRIPKMI